MTTDVLDYLVHNHWSELKVVYGFSGAYDPQDAKERQVLFELGALIRGGQRTTLYRLNDALELVELRDQEPPFANRDQLSYELEKEADLVALWLANDAIAVVYGFDDFVPGDRRSIAMLSQLANKVGPGTYTATTLTPDFLLAREQRRRFGVIGLFHRTDRDDVESLAGLLNSPQRHKRYVAAWALRQMRDRRLVAEIMIPRLPGGRPETDRDVAAELPALRADLGQG